jgi:hypothetical protein
MLGLLIVGEVSVLLVSIWGAVFCVTLLGNVGVPPIVYVPVKVPLRVAPLMVGDVSVLSVIVWLSVKPTGCEARFKNVLRLICWVVLSELVTIGKVSLTASIVAATGKSVMRSLILDSKP